MAGWVAGLALAVLPAAAGSFTGALGLQLESVRDGLKKDRPATLDEVRGFGFKYVELVGDYKLSPKALLAEMRAHKLEAMSAHFPYARFRDDPEALAVEASEMGLKFVGCPDLPQHSALDESGCREAIAVFNRAGEVLAKHGVKFFYHPHGYEFKSRGDGTFFDLMMAETDPRFVYFQMDIFWIVYAGQDPVKILERYPDRWVSLHVKDMKKGTPTGGFSGHADKPSFVALGQGQIDLPAILRTADKIGIKWYFLEDESAVPEIQIPQSVTYLRKVKW